MFEGFDADFPAGRITCIAGKNGVGRSDPRARFVRSSAPPFRTVTWTGERDSQCNDRFAVRSSPGAGRFATDA